MESELDKFIKAFDHNHVRRDARFAALVEKFRQMSPEDLTYTISTLYKNTSSDEYKLSWRDAAMAVYLGRLTDRLISGMSDLEKSNERLAGKTNELIVAVGDEGGHLTVVVGAVATFLTAALAWVATADSLPRAVAGIVGILSLVALGRDIRSHRLKRVQGR